MPGRRPGPASRLSAAAALRRRGTRAAAATGKPSRQPFFCPPDEVSPPGDEGRLGDKAPEEGGHDLLHLFRRLRKHRHPASQQRIRRGPGHGVEHLLLHRPQHRVLDRPQVRQAEALSKLLRRAIDLDVDLHRPVRPPERSIWPGRPPRPAPRGPVTPIRRVNDPAAGRRAGPGPTRRGSTGQGSAAGRRAGERRGQQGSARNTSLGATNSPCAATVRISRDPSASVRRSTP